MATTVTLPELGESVTEGTVTTWLKNVGDTVEVDEPLLEISTDKVDTEIPSPVAGTILEIKVEEDETVEVGADLAVIGDADESPSDAGGSDEAPAEPEETEDAAVEEGSSDEASAEQPGEEPARESDGTPVNQHGEEPHLETQSTGEGTEVTLPELGESVTEGTVTTWLKNVGDTVEVDEPLLEISTDKVDTEIPSPVAGTILEIKVEEDETVEVGAVLAVVGDASAAGSSSGPSSSGSDDAPSLDTDPAEDPEQAEKLEEAAEAEKSQPEKAEAATKDEAPAPTAEPAKQAHPENEARPEPKQEAPQQASGASTQGGGDTYVTPIVRKLAKEHGVDLATVTGTGVGGRIRKQDVLDAAKKAEQSAAPAPAAAAPSSAPAPAASTEPSPLRGKTEKLSRLRKVIASRLTESLQVSAQLTQVHEVDVTEIARLRAKHKDAFLEREGVKLTFLPFFAKAAVEALKAYPTLNASLDVEAGTITYPAGEHLGIAVDTERGLLVPTIKDAGDLSIAGLARKIADAAERTRTNKITPDELSGGTFSITNLGSNGALFDTPIINQPQVAILGVGAVVKRPVVITDAYGSDSIAVRSMAYLALTYDHRLIDGADAGRFLTAVKERLSNGSSFEGEL
jgi:2-oxoglutarate dehydrogenase E2 component (dihydrolipoamide succinyltransferase)